MSFFSLPTADTPPAAGGEVPAANEPPAKKPRSLVGYASDVSDDASDGPGDDGGAQWTAAWNGEHEAYYYTHSVSGETAWELPPGADVAWGDDGDVAWGASWEDGSGPFDHGEGEEEGAGFVAPHVIEPRCVSVSGPRSRAELLACVKGCGSVVACFQPRERDRTAEWGQREWCVRFATDAEADAACRLHGANIAAVVVAAAATAAAATSAGAGAATSAGGKDEDSEDEAAGALFAPAVVAAAAKGAGTLSVGRTTKRNFAFYEQPSKVCLRGVPLDATDAEVLAFLGVNDGADDGGSGGAAGRADHRVFRVKRQPSAAGCKPGEGSGAGIGAGPSAAAAGASPGQGGAPSADARVFAGTCIVSLASASAARRVVEAAQSPAFSGRALVTAASGGCDGGGGGGSFARVSVEVSQRRAWEGVSRVEDPGGGQGGGQGSGGSWRGGGGSCSGNNDHGHGGGRSGRSVRPPQERPANCTTVWLGGLPRDCDEGGCREALAAFGALVSLRVIKDPVEGDCKVLSRFILPHTKPRPASPYQEEDVQLLRAHDSRTNSSKNANVLLYLLCCWRCSRKIIAP